MSKEQDEKIKIVRMIQTGVDVPWVVNKSNNKKDRPLEGPELDLHNDLFTKGLTLSVPGDLNSEKIPYEPRR